MAANLKLVIYSSLSAQVFFSTWKKFKGECARYNISIIAITPRRVGRDSSFFGGHPKQSELGNLFEDGTITGGVLHGTAKNIRNFSG